MDEQREEDKSKWQNFSSKAFGKRGFVKKSIFKTPENAQGRVGIGTCGVSGQKMTTFSSANKYRKGQQNTLEFIIEMMRQNNKKNVFVY